MPGGSPGGRLIADARARASAPEPGEPRSVATVDSYALAPAAHAARAVTTQVELLLAFRGSDPVPESDEALAAATALAGVLDRGAATEADQIPVNQAISALSRLALRTPPPGRATIEAHAAGIAARAQARGLAWSSDVPGSRVVAASHDPAARLSLVRQAVQGRVGTALDALADETNRPRLALRLSEEAPRLAELLREAGAIAMTLRHDGAALSARVSELEAISAQVELLFVRAREARVGQAAAGLDAVFDGEDGMRVTAGLGAVGRRAGFYGDRNVTDLDDRPGRDERSKSGSALIEQIMEWFRFQPVSYLAGIADLSAMLDEPVMAKPASAFESVLVAAVQSFLGLVPGYLGNVLGQAVSGLAANPKLFEGAFGDAPLSGLAGKVGRHAPELLKHGAELLELNGSDKRALAAVWGVARKLPVPKPLSPTERAKHAIGDIAPHVGGYSPRSPAGDDRPLTHTFTSMLTDGLGDYLGQVTAQGWELRRALELVPPAGLQSMFEDLRHSAGVNAANVRADLVERWANVVATVTAGRTDHDTIAHTGTISQLAEPPGTVRIAVQVSPTGDVRPTSVRMSGLTASSLQALKDAKRPLATVALDRVFDVNVMEDEHTEHRVGRFDVGPNGDIDLAWVSSLPLLSKVGERGSAADRSTWTLGAALDGSSLAGAYRGARWIVEHCKLTTADIEGP